MRCLSLPLPARSSPELREADPLCLHPHSPLRPHSTTATHSFRNKMALEMHEKRLIPEEEWGAAE